MVIEVAFWVVRIVVGAVLLRAAVVWLGEVIEDGDFSAPSKPVKPTAKGSAKS